MTSAVELRRHRMTVAACFAFQRDTSSSVLVTTEVGYAKTSAFALTPDVPGRISTSQRMPGNRHCAFLKMNARWDFRTGADAVTIAGSDYPKSIALMSGSAITSASSSILKVESNVAFIFGSNVLLNKATYAIRARTSARPALNTLLRAISSTSRSADA